MVSFLSSASCIAAAFLLSIVYGRAEAAEGVGDLPAALVVAEGAQKIVGRPAKNKLDPVSVSYEVKTPYPASTVISEIQTKVEGSGWTPLPRESISPINPSSLRVGWRNHVNATPPPATQSFVWNAQWRNSTGDVVAFILMYLSKTVSPVGQAPKPDNDTLRVSGILTEKRLLPPETLPPALIMLEGAKDVSAWRLMDEQRLGYDLLAPRPPSEAMMALDKRLEKQGWKSEMEPPPPLWPENDWAKTHKPGWNFGRSRGYGGHLEWRSTWRNAAGSSVRYILTYAGVLPVGATVDVEHGITNYYVEATYSASGKTKVIVFPPSGTPSVRHER
jgi:hypothetical protein